MHAYIFILPLCYIIISLILTPSPKILILHSFPFFLLSPSRFIIPYLLLRQPFSSCSVGRLLLRRAPRALRQQSSAMY